MNAAEPAPPVPKTLFQVWVGKIRNAFILPTLREYAAEYEVALSNCANLSLVYLGLLQDPKKYLETCTGRGIESGLEEIDIVIRSALLKAGIDIPAFVEGVNPILEPVNAAHTFSSRLREAGEGLLPSHATILGLEFANGSRHTAILRKENDSQLTFLDFQIIMPDGSYPALAPVPAEGDMVDFYPSPVVTVFAFLGPNITSFKNSLLAKYEATGKEGAYMDTLGGKRKKKTMKRKINKRKHSYKHKSR
jgi:hypothetical protein